MNAKQMLAAACGVSVMLVSATLPAQSGVLTSRSTHKIVTPRPVLR